MSKVMMICGTFPPAHCGVGDYTYELLSSMTKLGHSVIMLTSSEYVNGDNNVRGIENWRKIDVIRKIINIAKEEMCSIIHIQWPSVSYFGSKTLMILIPILRFAGFKVILTLHEFNDCTTNYKIGRIPSILFATHTIVVDIKFIPEIKKYIPVKRKSNISFINIGSSIPFCKSKKDEILKLRETITNLDDEKIIISHFGFVNESKRVDVVLRALGRLKSKGKKFVYLMLTDLSYVDPIEYRKLIEIIHENDLENDIVETGFLEKEDVAKYLKCSDLAVLLFNKGVSPRNSSFLAAVQQGVKVITSDPKVELGFPADTVTFVDNDVNLLAETIIEIGYVDKYTVPQKAVVPQFDDIAIKHYDLYKNLDSKIE